MSKRRQRSEDAGGKAGRSWPPSSAALDRLVDEATVDAHDEDERLTGIFTLLQEGLAVPFDVEVLGVAATVVDVDFDEGGGIVAVLRRGTHRQRIPILDLALPRVKPRGAEWIEAYRRMTRYP